MAFSHSLATILAQSPPLGNAICSSGSITRGSIVLVPGRKLNLLMMAITPTLASSSANLIPIHARGPWPKLWKTYLEDNTKHQNKIVLLQ